MVADVADRAAVGEQVDRPQAVSRVCETSRLDVVRPGDVASDTDRLCPSAWISATTCSASWDREA